MRLEWATSYYQSSIHDRCIERKMLPFCGLLATRGSKAVKNVETDLLCIAGTNSCRATLRVAMQYICLEHRIRRFRHGVDNTWEDVNNLCSNIARVFAGYISMNCHVGCWLAVYIDACKNLEIIIHELI